MKDDFLIEGFSTPPHPKGLTFFGKSVRLEPLDIEKHSEDLHNANIIDVNGFNGNIYHTALLKTWKNIKNG